MPDLKETLRAMFTEAVINGSNHLGMTTSQLIPIYLEYIAYQIFQLAPL